MRLSINKALALVVLAGATALAGGSRAQAEFIELTISDAMTSYDSGPIAADSFSTTFTDGGYTIVIEAAAGNSPGLPPAELSLTSLFVTSTGNPAFGDLTIQATETDFSIPSGPVELSTSGSISPTAGQSGTSTLQGYADPNNVGFGTTDTSGLQTLALNGSASAQNYQPNPGTGVFSASEYSLSLTQVFNADMGAGTWSSSALAQVDAVPAPSTAVFALTGLPLLGLGFWMSRRRRRKAPDAA